MRHLDDNILSSFYEVIITAGRSHWIRSSQTLKNILPQNCITFLPDLNFSEQESLLWAILLLQLQINSFIFLLCKLLYKWEMLRMVFQRLLVFVTTGFWIRSSLWWRVMPHLLLYLQLLNNTWYTVRAQQILKEQMASKWSIIWNNETLHCPPIRQWHHWGR